VLDIKLNWRLKELLRLGVITQIDESRALVRVQFTDMDGVLSYWLAVLKQKTLKDKQYWMPDIGEHVACLIDKNGEEGIVLGAIYSDADAVPVSSKDKKHIKFEDGTIIEYDRAAHKLYADVKGDIDVKATGKCDVDCKDDVTVQSDTSVTIKAPTIMIINEEGGNVDGVFEGDFRVRGNIYVENGNIEVENGNIRAVGTIMDSAGNTNHHSHG
jgi:phage baseplate assembly protein V